MTANNCAPKYFTNKNQIGLRLNFRPVVGALLTGYTFEIFNPFVILGAYAQSGSTPNGGVGDATYNFLGNATEVSFPYQQLAQNLMCANRDGANQSGFLTYDANTNGPDLSGYFLRNMQEGLQDQNFGAFLMPHFHVAKWWEDWDAMQALATQTDYARTEHFQRLAQRLFDGTDLRLWNAPGIYTLAGAPPNTDSYYVPFDAVFGGGSIGDQGLIVAEIKAVE